MPENFDVISLHFTTECNLNCPICYRPKNKKAGKNQKFFIDMIPYLAELTEQVAIGGGEPFLFPDFLEEFSEKAKENNMITNITSNGRTPIETYTLKNIEMVSLSFDRYKIDRPEKITEYIKLSNSIRKKVRVGANLLIDKYMMEDPDVFLRIVVQLFQSAKVERVFALYPKNTEFIDILKHKEYYQALSYYYKHFYIDDLTNKILSEERYCKWTRPCHYGQSIVSINEDGYVTGCSFDGPEKALLKLEKPNDILKIKDIVPEKRYNCPYLKCNGGRKCQQSTSVN